MHSADELFIFLPFVGVDSLVVFRSVWVIHFDLDRCHLHRWFSGVTSADDCQREVAVAYDLQRDQREIETRIETTTSLVVRQANI